MTGLVATMGNPGQPWAGERGGVCRNTEVTVQAGRGLLHVLLLPPSWPNKSNTGPGAWVVWFIRG